jgi:rubrerythrin
MSKGTNMSEMTIMVTKKAFLEVCIRIEGICAELYHYYSKIYEDIPEASRLWKKTALEEENHQRQFELALRLIDETEFGISKDSLKRVYAAHNRLLKLAGNLMNKKPELLSAVSKALEMEEKLADLHAYTALNFTDESMKNLFNALSDADRDHVADLQNYRTTLHLPICVS